MNTSPLPVLDPALGTLLACAPGAVGGFAVVDAFDHDTFRLDEIRLVSEPSTALLVLFGGCALILKGRGKTHAA